MRRMLLIVTTSTVLGLAACDSSSKPLQAPGTGGSRGRADSGVGAGGTAKLDAQADSGGSPSLGGAVGAGGSISADAAGLGTGGNGPGMDGASVSADGASMGGGVDASSADGMFYGVVDLLMSSDRPDASDVPFSPGDADAADAGEEAGTADVGGTAKVFTDLFPRSGTVSGWTVDPESWAKDLPAATASTEAETEALIDGASQSFYTPPSTPQMFGVQYYRNKTVPDAPADGAAVTLFILKMPSASQAIGLYSALRSTNLYSAWNDTTAADPNSVWKDPSVPVVGDRCRIVNAGDTWWINFCKGVYYVEVRLTPSYGLPPDYQLNDANLKAAAFTFAASVANRL
jgi:hypothetical protein